MQSGIVSFPESRNHSQYSKKIKPFKEGKKVQCSSLTRTLAEKVYITIIT